MLVSGSRDCSASSVLPTCGKLDMIIMAKYRRISQVFMMAESLPNK